jgi:hypothetical protein
LHRRSAKAPGPPYRQQSAGPATVGADLQESKDGIDSLDAQADLVHLSRSRGAW